MYNTSQRKLSPLGYKLRFLFDIKESFRILGRDKDILEFQVLKGHIMRTKEQDAPWNIVSCRSNRREHPSNSFIARTKPNGLANVIASA
jgi:hypothetical protein